MYSLKRIITALSIAFLALAVSAAVADLPVKTINGKAYHYYEVKRGDTLYSLQRMLGVDRQTIVKYNPSVEDGLQAYQTLYFPVDVFPTPTPKVSPAIAAAGPSTHVVKKGESVYGIARQYGLTVDRLIELNPSLSDGAKAGETIIVSEDTTALDEPDYETEEVEESPEVEIQNPAPAPAQRYDQETAIAVILPFMLSEKTPSKQALRYTEFFKGLALAVDTMRVADRPVSLYAYDTAGSIDTLRMILRNSPELADVHAIIAPPEEVQLAAVARFASENGIMVVNPFAVKDESYLSVPEMMQLTTPSPVLVSKAVDEIMRSYGGRTPVLLKRGTSAGDHPDVISALKKAWTDRGVTPIVITYDNELTAANLARLSKVSGDMVFVPYEGKLAEVNKILPALVEYRESLSDPSRVMLLGYPEWVTFRGDARANLCKLNTVIYSRFFNDDESLGARIADEQFERWYGSAPEAALPKQGYMGLDLGMYLIQALRSNYGDFEKIAPTRDGIQNGFSFRKAEGDNGGWVNQAVYIINYRPSGFVDHIFLY